MEKKKKVRPCKPHGQMHCQTCKEKVQPQSLKNLIPWKPGQSGNPNNIRTRPITSRLDVRLEDDLPENLRVGLKMPRGTTWADAIVERALREALRGSMNAFNTIVERIEGRVVKESQTEERTEIILRVVYADQPTTRKA